MARTPTSDPRHPPEADYITLRQTVMNATPGETPRTELLRYEDEAFSCFRKGESWTGPDGEQYVAVLHPREVRNGSPDPQIVGYQKLRAKDWFVAKDGVVLYGPRTTKRGCLAQIGAKRGRTVEAGWYRAKGHDVFTRNMAEKVIGGPVE